MDTPLLQTPHYYRHPTITDTPLLLTPHYYGHPTITDIPLLRTTCHYGHALSGTTHYAGHPVFTDTTLLRTEATFPAETTKKSMEAILGTISDSSCYGIADTSCDLKPIFLFFSPYNGQLGPTKWHNFSAVLKCLLSIKPAYLYYLEMKRSWIFTEYSSIHMVWEPRSIGRSNPPGGHGFKPHRDQIFFDPWAFPNFLSQGGFGVLTVLPTSGTQTFI